MVDPKLKSTLLKDPAIEEWIYMRSNYKDHFRWNRKNAFAGIMFGIVVPLGIYYMAKKTYGNYILEPSLREDSKDTLSKLDKSKWT
ncbi:hypothetical protein BB559_000878, partial [Furculomyces boomerangus]